MSKMFKRSFASGSKDVGKVSKPPSKATRSTKRSFTHQARMKLQQLTVDSASFNSPVQSPVITLVVGRDSRMFACHSDVLCQSPFFEAVIRGQFYDTGPTKRIELPDEEPGVFSAVLEFLYKGDYYPRLLHQENKLKRSSWTLEDTQTATETQNATMDHSLNKSNGSSTLYHSGIDGMLLKDTAVYCSADRYGLADLQRIALRKQGLRTGIPVDVILRSARYAYENTPEHDAKLRAHFLALIIRSRRTFKRSGTMQMEMENGGSKLFFDLFVAMCNHIDDITDLTSKASPRTI